MGHDAACLGVLQGKRASVCSALVPAGLPPTPRFCPEGVSQADRSVRAMPRAWAGEHVGARLLRPEPLPGFCLAWETPPSSLFCWGRSLPPTSCPCPRFPPSLRTGESGTARGGSWPIGGGADVSLTPQEVSDGLTLLLGEDPRVRQGSLRGWRATGSSAGARGAPLRHTPDPVQRDCSPRTHPPARRPQEGSAFQGPEGERGPGGLRGAPRRGSGDPRPPSGSHKTCFGPCGPRSHLRGCPGLSWGSFLLPECED